MAKAISDIFISLTPGYGHPNIQVGIPSGTSPFSYKICNITALSVHTTLVISPQVHDGPTWADILLRAACSGWALVY